MPRNTPPRKGGKGSPARGRPRAKKQGGARPAAPAQRAPARETAARVPRTPAPPFRLGAVAGATPGTWIDRWESRRAVAGRGPLELLPIAVAEQRDALIEHRVDAAIVRLPIERDDLSVIPLYDEQPVVVMSVDSALTVADDLGTDDLAGEVVIVPADDVLAMPAPASTLAPAFAAPATTEDAIATVATGVGVVIVPMSLARLHHRRDVTFRPYRDGPLSPVALAWVAARTTDDVEAFIGIVRGRTENSSRG